VLRTDAPCHVLVDFDGTIAKVDTTDALLAQFALPAWHGIEDEWKSGAIGSRECMVRQIDLVRATPDAMDRFIESIEIDPDVPAFIDDCRKRGFEVTVVSDGLDRTVRAVLARHGINVPIRANALRFLGGDRWTLTFPHAQTECKALSGNCKCATPNQAKSALRVVVGDGRSDFCVAERADFVLAKSKLVEHVRAHKLPHAVFGSFAEAGRKLQQWLEQPTSSNRPTDADVAADPASPRRVQ
jgi:2-hydroxy-3-keto-5-methylthiopentenyl-1-phosphate phosphatase